MNTGAITTWDCLRPNCQARNVADAHFCSVCQAPRPSSFRQALGRIAPVDLEEFCRLHFAKQSRRHVAALDMVDGEVFLTLIPDAGDPAIFRVDENAVIPCDNFGRASW